MSVRRTVSQHALFDLIDPRVFQPRTSLIQDAPATTLYRIPEHQRFPSWPEKKKQRLVESVLNNWPIHALLLTKHIEVTTDPGTSEQIFADYYNIADGQTRLTALQEFYLDKFPTCDNLLYSQLTPEQRYNFTTYQVTAEVFIMDRISPAAARDIISDIFERVNSGKALGDNDKFYARRETPVVQFAVGLSKSDEMREHFRQYVGEVGGGKNRKLLGDMVGAVLSVAKHSELYLNTSYERNYSHLTTALTAQESSTVKSFFLAYFAMLQKTIGVLTDRPGKTYGKLSGILGLAICSWNNTGHIHDAIAWYATIKYYNNRYVPPSFADLRDGDRRNCQGSAIRNRLEKIIQQHQLSGGDVTVAGGDYNSADDADSDTD